MTKTASTADNDELLTRASVAELLNVSTRTLAAWADAGIGPPVIVLTSTERTATFRRKDRRTGKVREYPRTYTIRRTRYSRRALREWVSSRGASGGTL